MIFKNIILLDGSLGFPLYHPGLGVKILIVGILCFLETISTTVYLHRYRTHNSLKLNPAAGYFFELILWLTTGIKSALWVTIHKIHHKFSDKKGDTHSPRIPMNFLGFNITGPLVPFLKYFALYSDVDKVPERIAKELAHESKFSRFVFHKLSFVGPIVLLSFGIFLFGLSALWMWGIVFLYLPVVAGVGVNGFGHMNHDLHEETRDHAHDLLSFIEKLPKWAYCTFWPAWFSLKTLLNFMTGGEYRHYIHHFKLNSARLTLKRFDFDIGWAVIYFLWLVRLAKDIRYISNKDNNRLLRLG